MLVTYHKSKPLLLKQACSTEAAFIAIGDACLNHAQSNLDAVRANQEEGVHQMRVAFRRLRSCLKTFRAVIPLEASQALVKELRWLNSFLGPARDWDVFLTESLQPILARFPNKRSLQTLQHKSEEARVKHYQSLQQCLRDPRYQRMIVLWHDWLECHAWQDNLTLSQSAALSQPAVNFAAALLKRQHRRVVKRGEQFSALSAEERHQLRIRIKELRYATEFFASLFPSSTALDYAKAASKLQDCLGALNDLSVAEGLLNELQVRPASTGRALIEGWYACQADSQERDFRLLWETFLARPRPWKAKS